MLMVLLLLNPNSLPLEQRPRKLLGGAGAIGTVKWSVGPTSISKYGSEFRTAKMLLLYYPARQRTRASVTFAGLVPLLVLLCPN